MRLLRDLLLEDKGTSVDTVDVYPCLNRRGGRYTLNKGKNGRKRPMLKVMI